MSEQAHLKVDIFSTAKYPIALTYGPTGQDSVTVPPRGKLKGLIRDQLQFPLPAGLIAQPAG